MAGVHVRTIQRIEHGDGASFETLKAVANAFSVDVADLLAPPPEAKAGEKLTAPQQRVSFVPRVRTGRNLFAVVGGADMYAFDHDELDGDQVDLVAPFLQDVHDWGDMLDEPAERVRVPHAFNARIAELEERGLWVFAGAEQRQYRVTALSETKILHMNTATVLIMKHDNPTIVRLDGDDAVLPVAYGRTVTR